MADLRRSLVINFFSTSGAAVLQFVVSIILARILSPSEIGIYSMTAVVVNLGHVFRDFGVTNYIQREKELTPDKLRSVTGVVFTTSWIIAIVLLLASGWIGEWFREPKLVPVMRVLAVGFFFIPFGSITNSLLARNFEAKKEAVLWAIGTGSFCISCITLAKLGFGSMALAYANLINIIACGIGCAFMRPKDLPWLPSFKHWREVAHFGVGSLLSSCAGSLNNAVPDLLLGKLGSPRLVGLLSRANSTVAIFTYIAGSTVNYGAVAYLAQTYHRGESLAPTLSRATALLTGVGWAALLLTAILGHDIVLALYGPSWLEAVPAIPALSLAAAVTMMYHYVPMAVTAIGRPYLSTVPIMISVLTRIGFGVLLFNGSLVHFAWALCLATIVTAPVVGLQQTRHLGYPTGVMLRALAPSALVALGTGATGYLLQLALPSSLPALARLLIMLVPLAAVWYLLLRVTRHVLLEEIHRLAAPIGIRLGLLRPNV
ncbi:oligosaccharide flippase family protein [Massilia phyllosphaerae]|uniref:oligosaccharide flippase family protein n=1 Tax=Massilia phyllosphaerae TaxID=3106034 RepID=UPI002B1CC8C6|nr:oligosaccharide flippase family protein [Massilia sp. SGZ-792]